jgi:hypothetical protein
LIYFFVSQAIDCNLYHTITLHGREHQQVSSAMVLI